MNKSKAKGDRFEREIVNMAVSHGIKAFRNRMSRAPQGQGSWDVSLNGMKFECKKRKQGFKTIREFLHPAIEGVIIGADRDEPLLILRYNWFLERLEEWVSHTK